MEIVNINRKNDEYTIANKSYDFSIETIKLLLERGYNDTCEVLVEEFKSRQIRWQEDKTRVD